MLSLYRRGKVWWATGHVRGVRYRRSLDTQFKEEARLRILDLERELYSGKRLRPIPWAVFQAEFLAAVRHTIKPSTCRKYESVSESFAPFAASVQRLTPSEVSAFIQARRGRGVGDEGIKSDQRILHRILAFAVERGYLEKNPVTYKNLNSRSRNTQPFSREEVARMLEAAGTVTSPVPNATPPRADLQVILLTFLYTGLRISDVCGLERREVDFNSGQIIRRTQKRGKVVAIPLHPALESALQGHLAKPSGSPYVFPTRTGRKTLPETLDAILRRLWKRAGISGAHAHRFRDTFSVRLLEQGAELFDVAKLLGVTFQIAEKHYAPYTKGLRVRAENLIRKLESAQGHMKA